MAAAAALARVTSPTPADAVARQLRARFGLIKRNPSTYEWTRTDVLGLSRMDCRDCCGAGILARNTPCGCVTRQIFRALMIEWRYSQDYVLSASRADLAMELGISRHPNKRRPGGFRRAEFIADLELLVKRTLDTRHLSVWRMYCAAGAPADVVARQLGTDRGNLYHAVYRVEEQVGRAAREVRPHPLYPIHDYYFR